MQHEEEISEAIKKDLGKSNFESYMCETGLVLSELIASIIQECFPPEYVTVITGGRAENNCLLQEHFDYIFFTGSQAVGKEVMKNAAAHLTPVTLELGGKSPCIVEKSVNIKLAAKRIVFGKYLNCGQTCVAPDYIYCDKSIKEELIKELKHLKMLLCRRKSLVRYFRF